MELKFQGHCHCLRPYSLRWFCRLGLLLALLLTGPAHTAKAAQFSADTVEIHSGEKTVGKWHVGEDRYRVEISSKGQPLIVIVHQAEGHTFVLEPEKKQYRIFKNQSIFVLMQDLFQLAVYLEQNAAKNATGSELINGWQCQKFVYQREGKDVMAIWVAGALGFPICIELPGKTACFSSKTSATNPRMPTCSAFLQTIRHIRKNTPDRNANGRDSHNPTVWARWAAESIFGGRAGKHNNMAAVTPTAAEKGGHFESSAAASWRRRAKKPAASY